MKKLTLFIFISLFAMRLFGMVVKTEFTITGHITNLQNGTIYLNYTVDGKSTKDSCIVVAGKFNFSGTIKHPNMAFFRLDKSDVLDSKALFVFLSPSNMIIEFANQPFRTLSVKGSKSNNELLLWKEEDGVIKKKFSKFLQSDAPLNGGLLEKYNDSVILYNDEKFQVEYNFIKTHPQSFAGCYILNTHYMHYTVTQLKSIYDNMGDTLKNSKYGKELYGDIERLQPAGKGSYITNITGRDYVNNSDFNLSRLKGKYVIIDFWGSWCAPCIKLIPNIVAEHTKYHDKNIAFVSVSYDSDGNQDKCRDIIKKAGMSWTNIWESNEKKDKNGISSIYDVKAYPTFILIGPDGNVIERGEGDYGFLKCKSLLEKLL